MTQTIDTLIGNLESKAQNFSNQAFGYTVQGMQTSAGAPVVIPEQVIAYLTPGANQINISLPPDWDKAATLDIVNDIMVTLNAFFAKYYPAVSTEYTDWINKIASLVQNGVPIHEDNAKANLLNQQMDSYDGIRKQRAIREGYANRGYSLPPGVMVKAVLDDIDIRTEQLVGKSIGAANAATGQMVSSYKQVLSTAISTDRARTHAINAMSDLMRTASAMYSSDNEKKLAQLKAHAAAIEATLAYYRAELELDRINTNIYAQNADLRTQRFAVDGSFFGKNEGLQVQSAVSAAAQAARIAQAAYSALNTVVSASTVGF